MYGVRPLSILLSATLVSATACDRGPIESISGPDLSAPAFTMVGDAFSFTETFGGDCTASGKFEVTDAGFVGCASGAAVFDGEEDYYRTYLRTTDANYATKDFIAEVTVTVSDNSGAAGIAFVGFGQGTPSYWFAEPANDPTVYMRIFPTSFGGGSSVTNATSEELTEHIGGNSFGGDGTHRVRMTWNHDTRQLTFAIDANYVAGSPFVADAVLTPVTVASGVFDYADSRIFIGGAGDATFDDLTVTHLIYAFTGFFAPIANGGALNIVKAGSAIPVKFSLGSDEGLSIMAPGYPASAQIACEGAPGPMVEMGTVTPGSSALSYNAGSNSYQYVWKTDNSWAGTCRVFILKLVDGTEHTAKFSFR